MDDDKSVDSGNSKRIGEQRKVAGVMNKRLGTGAEKGKRVVKNYGS